MGVAKLRILLVLAPSHSRREGDNVPKANPSSGCPRPRSDQPRLEISCSELFYHDAVLEKGFEAPHFATMVSSGIGYDDRWTWEPSLQWLLQHEVPFVIATDEAESDNRFAALILAIVKGDLPDVPVVLEATDGAAPFKLVMDEAYYSFLYLSKIGANIRNVTLNPFRFAQTLSPEDNLPKTLGLKCPPHHDLDANQQMRNAFSKVQQDLTASAWDFVSDNLARFPEDLWVSYPPASMDDFCWSWESILNTSALVRFKNAVILSVEGFATGESACKDCPIPGAAARRRSKEEISLDDVFDEEGRRLKKARSLDIPVSRSYVETWAADKKRSYGILGRRVAPKADCSAKFAAFDEHMTKLMLLALDEILDKDAAEDT